MRIIISPAKQMRVDTDSFACKELPVFMDRTRPAERRAICAYGSSEESDAGATGI